MNKGIIIYDNIHGYIEVDLLCKQIIDTPLFQRLRRIQQVGVLKYIFPTCIHTRFEHSIGTYYLANKMITNLQKNQPELGITTNIIKVIKIAGLCHDLGHLLYSHLFDDMFLPKLKNYSDLGDNVYHEVRSVKILGAIIDRYNINITKDELTVIGDLINSNTNNYNNWISEFKIGKWIFEII